MKKSFIFLGIMLVCSCQKTMDVWQEETSSPEITTEDGQKNVPINLKSGDVIASSATIFLQNTATNAFQMYSTKSNSNGEFILRAYPGSYIAHCVLNTNDIEKWKFADTLDLEDIYYTIDGIPADIAYGKQDNYTISESDNNNSLDFTLTRKVAKLKVTINNIVNGFDDLCININDSGDKFYIDGKTFSSNGDVSVKCAQAKNGTSITEFLIFPPEEKEGKDYSGANIYLSSENMQVQTRMMPIKSIKANHITELTITLQEKNIQKTTITAENIAAWSTENITDEFTFNIPTTPCTGNGNGEELVINGGFENNNVTPEDTPVIGWKYGSYSDKNSKEVSVITGNVKTGNNALEIKEKTEIYQDIAIAGGLCYIIDMYINSPVVSNKQSPNWKYKVTWYKGSSELSTPAESIDYEKDITTEFKSILGDKILRAPEEATKLRIEATNYSNGAPIYLDDVSVQLVE